MITGTPLTLYALARAGLRMLQARLALVCSLIHRLAWPCTPSQTPADNFMALVQAAGDGARALFRRHITPGMKLLTPPMYLPASSDGKRPARLQAMGPYIWPLWWRWEPPSSPGATQVPVRSVSNRRACTATALQPPWPAGPSLPAWMLGYLLAAPHLVPLAP